MFFIDIWRTLSFNMSFLHLKEQHGAVVWASDLLSIRPEFEPYKTLPSLLKYRALWQIDF